MPERFFCGRIVAVSSSCLRVLLAVLWTTVLLLLRVRGVLRDRATAASHQEGIIMPSGAFVPAGYSGPAQSP